MSQVNRISGEQVAKFADDPEVARIAGVELGKLLAEDRIRRPPIEIVHGQARITNLDQAQRVAAMMFGSGMYPDSWVPKNANSAGAIAAIALCLMFGSEHGFGITETMTCVMIVRKVPSLWGEGPMNKVLRSGLMEDFGYSFTGQGESRTCRFWAKRRGKPDVFDWSFGAADARRARLTDKDTYSQWTDDMYFARARSRVLRRAFADALGGIRIAEEEMDGEAAARQESTDDLTARIRAIAAANTPPSEPNPPQSPAATEMIPAQDSKQPKGDNKARDKESERIGKTGEALLISLIHEAGRTTDFVRNAIARLHPGNDDVLAGDVAGWPLAWAEDVRKVVAGGSESGKA